MANFVYKKAKQGVLNGEFDFSSNSFKVLFVSSNYIPSENNHEFVSDIEESSIIIRSSILSNVTNQLGIIDAQDVSFTIPANTSLHAMVFYQIGSTDANSRLLFYVDTADGLPYPGSAEEVSATIGWSNLAGKILSI